MDEHLMVDRAFVARSDFSNRQPELHHYTTFDGLQGIYESRSLRATRFTDLNDSSEYIHLKRPLLNAVAPRFEQILRKLRKIKPSTAKKINAAGGIREVASVEAARLIEDLYSHAYDKRDDVMLTTPYTLSFCSHGVSERYERDNGLLSQWRGYGKGGGFCLVFDTARLVSMLEEEDDTNAWAVLKIDDVRYGSDLPQEEEFLRAVEVCEVAFRQILRRTPLVAPYGGFFPFHRSAPFFKHPAFREEREVRVVAIPYHHKMLNVVRMRAPWLPPPLIKKIHAIGEGELRRHFLYLFSDLATPLPIKRVIVGPSRHQVENRDRARAILDPSIPLIMSETPFLG